MGRRSRKRAATEAPTRAERDAARRQRTPAASTRSRAPRRPRPGRPAVDDRPPAPWGNFPLNELVVLLGIGLMVWGLVTWSGGGTLRFGAGLAVTSLAGLELSLREHLAGFRSHTTLLAGVIAFVVVTALVLGFGHTRLWAVGLAAALAFAGSFYGLREVFKRRSGGLGFR